MSKYTTEVRFICESMTSSADLTQGFASIDDVLTEAAPRIFNFTFPLFDEAYRLPFEKMILRHFYTREICEETVGLWKLRLWDRLNTIMPYYNKLYLSETLEFNPLYDVDYTRTSSNTETGQTSQTGNETNETNASGSSNRSQSTSDTSRGTEAGQHYDLYSDTPQGALTGLENESYLTNARKVTDDGQSSESRQGSLVDSANSADRSSSVRSSTGASTVNNLTQYVERVSGKQGSSSYSYMLKEYRDTLINIDQMVLEELSDLFMNIW